MGPDFEAGGNIDDWPPNVAGKETQAAVFGAYHLTRGKVFELLWTGKFPDLEPAMYWAAKKEVQAVRKDKWIMASRLIWQHDLTPEQALAHAKKVMEPQLDDSISQLHNGIHPRDFELAPGMMHPVNPKDAKGYYAELIDNNDPEGEPIASFIGEPPSFPLPSLADFKSLRHFLSRIPAVVGKIECKYFNDTAWWAKLRIDIHHPLVWQVVQELGFLLNCVSLKERLGTVFMPVITATESRRRPDEELCWVIESHGPDFTPDDCVNLLEKRLPQPVNDPAAWKSKL